MTRDLIATVGFLTPLQGWKKMTWSLSAVVKIADSTVAVEAIVTALIPLSLSATIHARTCSGRMSIIRMPPNSGIKCLPIV